MSKVYKTPVAARNEATGEVITFSSIREAQRVGGFTYTSVRMAIRTGSVHAGYTFEAKGPTRTLKRDNVHHRVARLRNKGLTNGEIAIKLGLTKGTVVVAGTIAHQMGLCGTYWETREELDCRGKL